MGDYKLYPPSFTAEDWFNVVGRGLIAIVRIPEPMIVRVGDRVLIDGKLFLVHGCETTCPSNPAMPVGLIVRPIS